VALTLAGGAGNVLLLFLSCAAAGALDVVECRHFRAAVSSEKMPPDQWVGAVLKTFDDIFARRGGETRLFATGWGR
jgi:hypothetical protein